MTSEPDMKKSRVSMMVVKSQQSRVRSVAALAGRSMSRLKVRRLSYGYTGVPGVRPVSRTSQLGIEFKRPPLVYLNTYQLDPFVSFHVPKVKFATEELLDEHFTGHKYNPQESPTIAIRMAGELMRRVKEMEFNRYRIITAVTIGQKRSQSYNNAISFIWDHERDNYVDVQREVTTAFIQVIGMATSLKLAGCEYAMARIPGRFDFLIAADVGWSRLRLGDGTALEIEKKKTLVIIVDH